jgi:hypothetical protein
VLRSGSLAWQRSIHDRGYRYSTTSYRNPTQGADVPRSELFVALRGRSMQYPEYTVPRIQLPRPPVNKLDKAQTLRSSKPDRFRTRAEEAVRIRALCALG